MDDIVGMFVAFALLGLMIAVFVIGMFAAVPIGIAVAIGFGAYYYFYGPQAKEKERHAKTVALYEQALKLSPPDRSIFEDSFCDVIPDPVLQTMAMRLFDMEGFTKPPKPPPITGSIEEARYRDQLSKYISNTYDPDKFKRFIDAVAFVCGKIGYEKPNSIEKPDYLFEATSYRSNEGVHNVISPFYDDRVDKEFFFDLRRQLDKNFEEQRKVFPTDYKGDNCAWDYLKETPLLPLGVSTYEVDFVKREEHTHILGSTGSGKSNLIEYFISRDLEEDCCVIVIDSQTKLINKLAHLDIPIDELSWISPKNELALNLFDIRYDEIKGEREREQQLNKIIELLGFVFEDLMDVPFTPLQRSLFSYVTQLLVTKPGGNIETFVKILKDPYEYADDINKMPDHVRNFFNVELRENKTYNGTRQELGWRLDAILENPTLRRIFSAKENPIDMHEEMQDTKLLLIDTDLSMLGKKGSQFFGRLFIAQILRASYQRVSEGKTARPVYLYVDEAQEYFNSSLEDMLHQARKANIGLIIAHQELQQSGKESITAPLMGNTATKFAATTSHSDASAMAKNMRTTANTILEMPEYHFAMFHKSMGSVVVKAPNDPLRHFPANPNFHLVKGKMEEFYGPDEKEPKLEEEHKKKSLPDRAHDDGDITPSEKW